MKKLIMWNVVTVDGYFEGEKVWDLDFHEYAWGKELEEFIDTQLAKRYVVSEDVVAGNQFGAAQVALVALAPISYYI